jgi:phosphoribosylanthranilate isomerase
MITQLYEISSPKEVQLCLDVGVDHIGILVGHGNFPREVSPSDAAMLANSFRGQAKVVALSLSASLDEIKEVARIVSPDILHLGAAPEELSLNDVVKIKQAFPNLPIMRSIPMVDDDAISLAQSYEGLADWFLLDSHAPGDKQIGALGVTHDWDLSARLVQAVSTPCILAGGLGPDNVAASMAAVQPAGVDSKTRTDIDDTHKKDPDKVRAFVQNSVMVES